MPGAIQSGVMALQCRNVGQNPHILLAHGDLLVAAGVADAHAVLVLWSQEGCLHDTPCHSVPARMHWHIWSYRLHSLRAQGQRHALTARHRWLSASTNNLSDGRTHHDLSCTRRTTCAELAHRAANEIGQSNEICHKTCLWTLIHLCWSALLLQTAGVHDSNAVRECESFFLVMGHVDKRDANRALQRLQFGLHLLAKLEIQRAERLHQ